MSVTKTISTYNNNNLVKHKAQMINERRRQSQVWLRRQEEQKEPGAPQRSVTQTPDGSHSAATVAAGSGQQSFGSKK
jgi:hypothetical protein